MGERSEYSIGCVWGVVTHRLASLGRANPEPGGGERKKEVVRKAVNMYEFLGVVMQVM